MVFKRALLLVIGAFVSASIAVAGGPDITYKPSPPKPKKMVETVIEPISPVKTVSSEAPKAQMVPAQPSDSRPAARGRIEAIAHKEATAKKVTVLFESNPQNSELMVNGLYVGSTPIQIPLYDGVHNVKVVAPGYTLWERQIKAYQGLRVYALLEKGKERVAANEKAE